MTDSISRRTALKSLGAGLTGALALGTGSVSAATAFEDELETVRQATEKYRSVGAALEDGFRPSGPYVPGMGWHWTHPERIQAAAEEGLGLDTPQVLTYADTDPGSGDGHLVLGAAEWGIPVGARGYTENDPPDLFSDEGAHAHEHWHVHHSRRHLFAHESEEVSDPGSLSVRQLLQRGRWTEVPADAEVQPGDEVTADWGLTGSEETRVVDLAPQPHPELLTLHAWVHIPNRRHPLVPVNPNLKYVEMLPNGLMSDRTAKPG